jgi:hypothetical protein
MITGAHVIIYSKDAAGDKDFIRDVLGFANVDVGGGWLIFALPPAEVAVHPGEDNDRHELYLMCDDVQAFIAEMTAKHVECAPIHEERWGSLTFITLPGGGRVGVYQPKHASPQHTASTPHKASAPRKAAKKAAKKPAKKPARGKAKKPTRRR